MADEITVYWTPHPVMQSVESWHFLYKTPEPVVKKIIDEQGGDMRTCPAVKKLLKNTFTFNSMVKDNFKYDNKVAAEMAVNMELEENTPIPAFSQHRVPFVMPRPSSLSGYINAVYYMSWLFFSEESLEANFTAPYFPPKVPAEGALFSPGMFDIGRWFRPVPLDYHIPISTDEVHIDEGDELMYVQFLTDKKINLRRFEMNEELWSLAEECIWAHKMYGAHWKLEERYELGENSQLRQRIIKAIKKQLLED